MLTIFACPKPFTDPHIAIIQRNAITSWTLLRPRPEIILFGDEAGTAEICRELGLRHVPEVARNEFGTPLLNDIFEKAQRLARYDLLCYVNADIILMNDFMWAVMKVTKWRKNFLLTGQRHTVEITEYWSFGEAQWEAGLQELITRTGKVEMAFDYFVFPRGLYWDVPAFAIGRGWFDHWLIWRARARKVPVVDATSVVTAVHQKHDYSHATGKKGAQITELLLGEEARRNGEIACWGKRAYTIADATHRLTRWGLYWNPVGHFRVKAHCIHLRYVILRWTQWIRHPLGLRRART
ncbi:MAG: hypothetical protein QXO20_06115 [Candidatus Bathyarchaeia archaeon]